MKGINQNINVDLITERRSIALAEMVGEGDELLGRNLHRLRKIQMTTIRRHQLGDLDLEGMSAQGVIDPGHVVTPDQEGVEGTTHLKRKDDLGQKREKMNIDHQKRRGEMTLLHHLSMKKISPRINLPGNLNR